MFPKSVTLVILDTIKDNHSSNSDYILPALAQKLNNNNKSLVPKALAQKLNKKNKQYCKKKAVLVECNKHQIWLCWYNIHFQSILASTSLHQ